MPQAPPSDLATLQIVDFSTPGEDAVADLARALLASPGAVPLPDPLPDQPEPPLSYLTSLVDLVTSPRELTKSEQMDIVVQLERGLEASDPDEREGARHVLRRMASRDDLASSVEKTIALLEKEHLSEEASSRTRDGVAVAPVVVTAPRPSATVSRPTGETGQSPRAAQPATQQQPVTEPAGGGAGGRRRPLLVGVALAVIAVLVGGGYLGRRGQSDRRLGHGRSRHRRDARRREDDRPRRSRSCDRAPAPTAWGPLRAASVVVPRRGSTRHVLGQRAAVAEALGAGRDLQSQPGELHG